MSETRGVSVLPRFCTYTASGRYYGARFGRRMGRGRGIPWRWSSALTDKELLEEQRDVLKARLKVIDEELKDL